MNNVYCFKCKKIVKSKTSKCPECKSNGKIVGKVLDVSTSNGRYNTHF